MAFDYLAETIALVSFLKVEGLDEYAAKLQEAMDGGATGTEILFRVRHTLKTFATDDLSDTAKARIKKLLEGTAELIK